MIPGDFQYRKPSRKKIILVAVTGIGGLAGLVVTALIITYVISAWIGRPVIFGYDDGPEQPIAFPHTTHVQQLGLDCTFCHRTVADEPVATIPAVGLCMTCHQVVGEGKPEVEKLREYAASGQSIDWVRVHRVPDHVHFVHEAHIRFFMAADPEAFPMASAVCSTCHGDVGSMVQVRQVRSLKMSDCVDCHRDNSAPTDCTTCHY